MYRHMCLSHNFKTTSRRRPGHKDDQLHFCSMIWHSLPNTCNIPLYTWISRQQLISSSCASRSIKYHKFTGDIQVGCTCLYASARSSKPGPPIWLQANIARHLHFRARLLFGVYKGLSHSFIFVKARFQRVHHDQRISKYLVLYL